MRNVFQKLAIVIVAWLAIINGVYCEGKAQAENLLINGDFTEGTKSWARACLKDDRIFSENGIVIIQHKSNDFLRIYQDVKIESGKTYLLKYQTKVEGSGATSTAWLIFKSVQQKWLEDKVIFIPGTSAAEWTNVEFKFKCAEDVDTARINFGVKQPGSAQIKNVTLTLVE